MLNFLRSESLAARAGYLAVAGVAMRFVVWGAWPNPDYYPVDFKYFWLAGTLWNAGISPYGAEILTLGAVEFPGERINPFFYPPNWRAIASLAALSTPEIAETAWAVLSGGALALSSWQLALLSRRFNAPLSPPRMFAIYVFVIACVTHGGEIAIIIGQPTPFILAALMSLLIAVDRSNAALATIAMTVLFLKPQLSIPLAAVAMFIPFLRMPMIIAGAVTGLLAVFGLGLAAPAENALAFLENIDSYKSFPENWPIHMSGPNFLFALFGIEAVSAFVLLGLSIIVTISSAVFLVCRRIDLCDKDNALHMLLFAVLTAAFLMPTHNFDFLAAMPAMLFVTRFTGPARLALIVGLFLVMRSMSLSLLTDAMIFADKTSMVGLYDTIGSALLFIVIGGALLRIGRNVDAPLKQTGQAPHSPPSYPVGASIR